MDALEALAGDRAVAVIRTARVADAAGLVTALAAAGIRCVEFTFTIPAVLDAIRASSGAGGVVGAGTVVDVRQAEDAIAAGARFVVSPVFAPQLVETCNAAGVPIFLGALTPTEVWAAADAGATAVKLFPARLGGPAYVRDLRGPFPDLALLPSGGIDERNAHAFLEAGALAVYAGSGLAPPELVEAGDHAEIGRRAHAFVASLK